MEYTIWLQILMELALAVSGEQEIDLLLKNTSRALHRKLDCTHIVIYKNTEFGLNQIAISPHWAQNDDHFLAISRRLSEQCKFEEKKYLGIEDQNHFYYIFLLKGYGSLCIARGREISIKLIKELPTIMDMLATNLQACDVFAKQIQVEKELRKQKDYIEYLAYHDTLTTLPNRRKYTEQINEYLESGEKGAIILLDLDNFKRINDSLGHIYGDEVLKYISRDLKRYISSDLCVYRVGGDEFLLLIREKTREEIEEIIHNIFNDFNKVLVIGANKIELTFSMGITMFPEDGRDVSQLFMNADLALYSVKNQNKNGHRFFDYKLSKEMLQRLTITNYLREAIDSDGFKIVYQPQVDLKTGKVIALEALLRFKYHSTSANEFIPVAEENQMILEIGRIVTEKVIRQLRDWMDKGNVVKPVSINFSRVQIHDVNYFAFLKDKLKQYQVDPDLIEFEITESILIKNKKFTIEFLEQLKSMGVRLVLDDYGTGYSSLYYLTSLPLDKIKIDCSVNQKFLEGNMENIIKCVIDLAHNLGFEIVAEGIEVEEQFQLLKKAKCDSIQGYLFCKPLEADVVLKTLNINYLDIISEPIQQNNNEIEDYQTKKMECTEDKTKERHSINCEII